jgi:hypothetical protein
MTTDSRPLSIWETLILTVQLKAQKVLKKGLGIVGTILWVVMAAAFFARFVWLFAFLGWTAADRVITWTSHLFR